MNKIRMAWTLPCLLAAGGANANIIISEVVEGSGFNKAIEIANIGDSTVTLDGYLLQKETNFGGTWAADFALDGITLQPFETYVVGHASAAADLKALFNDENSTIANFNGNDPLRIIFNGEVIDLFGAGDAGDSNFNSDITLVRCEYSANGTWDASQWLTFPKDDWSDLGHIAASCDAPEAPEAPVGEEATIAQLQGEGQWSPYTDPANYQFESEETFVVKGVITHVQNTKLDNDLLTGFFMQDPAADTSSNASNGIFVNANVSNVKVGDEVAVTAKVQEYYSWTQLGSTSAPAFVEVLGEGENIEPTTITALESDENFEQTLERYEGMLVRVNAETDMHVARTFGFDYSAYRNNMVLAHQSVNYHPNQLNTPLTAGAAEQDASNADRRLFVESSMDAADGVVPWYPNFAKDNGTGTSDDYIRVGAQLSDEGLTGVLGYSYSEYRLYVHNTADNSTFVENERSQAPNLEEGDLVVSSFNVLNFFNSPFGGRDNPTNSNRGAETIAEFDMQLEKIVSALVAIDADIYGLIEIENNGFDEDSAIHVLVEALNSHLDEADHYQIAMPSDLEGEGFVGTDAITNKIIYRPSTATLNDTYVIELPQQHVTENGNTKSAYQRDAFTASFAVEHAEKDLVISTNHFKSKGSTCWEDEATADQENDVNLQGSCEHFRVSAAYQLAQELNKIDGYKVVMGDLNSYGQEDAILVLTNRDNAPADYEIHAARNTYIGGDATNGTLLHGEEGALIEESFDYLDIVEELKPRTYSYSFNDTMGTLDYVLVDNELKDFVVDAEVWSINAVESTLFEYANQFTGDLVKFNDAYRSSDHDPTIVVFSFNNNDEGSEDEGDNTPEGDNGSDNDSQEGGDIDEGSSGGSFDFFALILMLTGLFARARARKNA
ncbi:ExeM/NucH family extracellular endonuclease [Vibrio ezurae]|uniref:Putative nuclease n=1 Tax=Vibrio ezurae NBRC 102218 TaxID=1219080 RepID=U3CI79_9VIBR|nr:ExeM/NucH family extracellular endonuclease [Vibrio ezurae]GAD80864.1 putative nuclease [Vibrio ezurae NBRC 102218]